MSLIALFQGGFAVDANKSRDAKSVFGAVADALIAKGVLDAGSRDDLAAAFLTRETQGSTAFGGGFALPHVFHPAARQLQVVVVRAADGISMASIDGQPTSVLICLVAPESARAQYLEVLRFVVGVTRNRDWKRFMQRTDSAQGILDVLIEAAST